MGVVGEKEKTEGGGGGGRRRRRKAEITSVWNYVDWWNAQ